MSTTRYTQKKLVKHNSRNSGGDCTQATILPVPSSSRELDRVLAAYEISSAWTSAMRKGNSAHLMPAPTLKATISRVVSIANLKIHVDAQTMTQITAGPYQRGQSSKSRESGPFAPGELVTLGERIDHAQSQIPRTVLSFPEISHLSVDAHTIISL